MKRWAVALVLVLAACGHQPVAYRPVAFGENGRCYYVQDIAEAVALQRSGLCHRDWVPVEMPPTWHYRYWNYYSSPAYYRAYVPSTVRTVYLDREKYFGSANREAITTEARQATYKGSNGRTVPASKIGAAKYGGGNRFGSPGTKFGGGDRSKSGGTKVKAPPKAPAKSPAKSPTKSPAKSPSLGGGARVRR